jgi:hypothetical protein
VTLRRLFSLCAFSFLLTPTLFAQPSAPQKEPAPQDRESFFRSIVVEPGETVSDVECIFCSVTIRGTAKGDVAAIWGSVVVEGTVDGDVAAIGGSLFASAGSHINGNAAAVGGRIVKEDDAKITVEESVPYIYLPGQRQFVLPGALYFLACSLVLALLPLVILRTRRVQNLNDACRFHPWLALFLGAILMAAIIYLLSVTEKFGSFEDAADYVLIAVLFVLLMPGCAGVSLALGRLFMRDAGAWLAVFLGAFLLALLSLVPLLGLLIFVIAWVLALGATSLACFGFASVNPSAQAPSTPAPGSS